MLLQSAQNGASVDMDSMRSHLPDQERMRSVRD